MSDIEFPAVEYRQGNARLWWTFGIIGVVVLIALGVTAAIAVQQLPPGTTVAGQAVRTPAQAEATADEIGRQLSLLPVEFRTAAGSTTVMAGEVGVTLDDTRVRVVAEDTVGFSAWADRFTGGGPVALPIDVRLSDTTDLGRVVAAVTADPVDGDVQVIADGSIQVTDPVVGVLVDAADIRAAVTPEVRQLSAQPSDEWPQTLTVELEAREVEPVVGSEAVERAVAELETLIDTPITVTAEVVPEDPQTVDGAGVPTREQIERVLTGAQIGALLTTEVDPEAIRRERLRVVPDTSAPPLSLTQFVELADVVPDMAVQVENRSPVPVRGAGTAGPGGEADRDAYSDVSTVTGDLVATVTTPGLEPDLQATAQAVVAAALAGEGTVAVQGREITDADPALLGITEPVGTYTTYYAPGETRTINIERFAQLMDGMLVPPGGNLEINHAIGERTAADGFVGAGSILDGEFVDSIGGGVSQFATTFFNAMWFAGFDIITHTPHSFYFERYPAGREATIDYPGVDLEFNNNTPHWVLVDTFVNPDSVTVTFWSTDTFDVTQSIGPREPAPGRDFTIAIERLAVAPAIPELDFEAVNNDDRFVHTYNAQ